jgi:hypothetical protein
MWHGRLVYQLALFLMCSIALTLYRLKLLNEFKKQLLNLALFPMALLVNCDRDIAEQLD